MTTTCKGRCKQPQLGTRKASLWPAPTIWVGTCRSRKVKILNKFCATWRSWWTETCQRSSRRRRKGGNRRAAACPRLTRWQNGRRTTPLSPSPASNFPAYQTPPPPLRLHGSPRQPQPPHWVHCPHPDHPCGRPPTNAGDQESRWGRGATRRSPAESLLVCSDLFPGCLRTVWLDV